MIERTLVALYTLLGLVPLATFPALFYVLVFVCRRQTHVRVPLRGHILMHDVVLSVTVANGVLLAVMVVVGLLGWFRPWTVGGLTLVLLVAPTPLWRRLFAPDAPSRGRQFIRGSAALTREHLRLLVLFLLFSLGALMIRRYPYHSDTWGKYLGAGAAVAETGRIPSLDLAALQVDYTNAPLVMLYNAWEFSLWGRDDRVARAVPVYFTTLTLFLLLSWGSVASTADIPRSDQPAADSQDLFPYLVTAALIVSQAFFRSFVGIIQEPPLLFFVTLGFYFLCRTLPIVPMGTDARTHSDAPRSDKSSTDHERSARAALADYGLAIVACTCALLSKFSAPIPILLIGFFLLIEHMPGIPDRRQFALKLAWGALLSWPAALWLGRNWAIWGNPIYPQLEHLLGRPGRLHELTLVSSQIARVNLEAAWIPPTAFLLDMALTFPFAPLAVVRMVRERRHPLTWILIAWGLATLAFLFVTGARWLERYFYAGIGLYALYAALGALDIRAHILRRGPGPGSRPGRPMLLRCLEGPRWMPNVTVILLMAALLTGLYVKHPVPYAVRPHEEAVVSYFQANVPEGETVTMLVDTSLVTWYDPARSYRQWRFHDLPFLLATDGRFNLEADGLHPRDAACFHDQFIRAGVSYIYASPQRKTRPHFWEEVAGHPEYFEPVLDADGAHLWRVRADTMRPRDR